MAILHSVFFYFKEDLPEGLIEAQHAAILQDLSKIDAIDHLWAGMPEGIERDVVDNSYGMSLHMLFNDREALQRYQTDPIHTEFLTMYKPNWTHIKVYDTRV